MNIRNFSIIAHIDHGKSTLADRLLEITKTVEPKKMRAQFMDQMELEQERGITIKAKTARMVHQTGNDEFILNLIDTPGHIDFSYEVSRALFCCEGAVLLVDAVQGIQAQTLSNIQKAQELNLAIIPVINKIDLKHAEVEKTKNDLINLLKIDEKEIISISAKTGENVDALLKAIIKNVPPPLANKHAEHSKSLKTNCQQFNPKLTAEELPTADCKALIFDSLYDKYKGVIVLVRIFSGQINQNKKIRFLNSNIQAEILELGYLAPFQNPTKKLNAGEVGYIATGLKDAKLCRVGDTIVDAKHNNPHPIAEFKQPKPVVFASFYSVDSNDYAKLRQALETLKLSDASLEFTPESNAALGQGFKVGFLGLLHIDIVKERLEREFKLDLIIIDPSVEYEIKIKKSKKQRNKKAGKQGKINAQNIGPDRQAVIKISSAKDFPDPSTILESKEPWAEVKIIAPQKYLGAIIKLCEEKRGKFIGMKFPSQAFITYEIPLAEIIVDFADRLKSISSGFASFDYSFMDYRPVDLVKLDILVHRQKIEPLSRLVIRRDAQKIGRQLAEQLKEILPRQQFNVAVQAAVGGKIIARVDVPALRKNVLSGIYGGHRERKDKLLDRQKRGKEKMKKFGKVRIPKEAFRITIEK